MAENLTWRAWHWVWNERTGTEEQKHEWDFAYAGDDYSIENGIEFAARFTIDPFRGFLLNALTIQPTTVVQEGDGSLRERSPSERDAVEIPVDAIRLVRVNDLRDFAIELFEGPSVAWPDADTALLRSWAAAARTVKKYGKGGTPRDTLAQWAHDVLTLEPDGGGALDQLHKKWPDLSTKSHSGVTNRIRILREGSWVLDRLPKVRPGLTYAQYVETHGGEVRYYKSNDGHLRIEVITHGSISQTDAHPTTDKTRESKR